jgi:hypothetical protein
MGQTNVRNFKDVGLWTRGGEYGLQATRKALTRQSEIKSCA